MKVGTRRSMVTGGALFGSAFGLTALGVSMHSLPLMYAGNCKLFIFKKSTYIPIFLRLRSGSLLHPAFFVVFKRELRFSERLLE